MFSLDSSNFISPGCVSKETRSWVERTLFTRQSMCGEQRAVVGNCVVAMPKSSGFLRTANGENATQKWPGPLVVFNYMRGVHRWRMRATAFRIAHAEKPRTTRLLFVFVWGFSLAALRFVQVQVPDIFGIRFGGSPPLFACSRMQRTHFYRALLSFGCFHCKLLIENYGCGGEAAAAAKAGCSFRVSVNTLAPVTSLSWEPPCVVCLCRGFCSPSNYYADGICSMIYIRSFCLFEFSKSSFDLRRIFIVGFVIMSTLKWLLCS